MFLNYITKKFLLSAVFSSSSTMVMLSRKSSLDNIQHLFVDYLFFFFMLIGLAISLMHEYTNKKRTYNVTFMLVIMSIFISVSTTVLIWVFYQNEIVPQKMYYGLVLFTSVFSPGIVRYLLTYLPEKIGKNILNAADRFGNKVGEDKKSTK